MHPNGRFVYASNLGPDNIAVCAVEAATGRLNVVAVQNRAAGKRRGISGSIRQGRFMLVSNQDSDRVDVFGVDGGTGKLTATGVSAAAEACCRVAFVPVSA